MGNSPTPPGGQRPERLPGGRRRHRGQHGADDAGRDEELDRLDGQPIPADRDELVHAVARAALMGARGNSGVILSQIVRGAAEELASRPGELVDPVLVAAAFARAADAAYESVRDPRRGHDAHRHPRDGARRLAPPRPHGSPAPVRAVDDDEQDQLLADVLEVATLAGEKAVERTPDQLDVLAEAGVVDAGAHGLVVILAGIVAGLRDDFEALPELAHHEPARADAAAPLRQPVSLLHQLHRHRRGPRRRAPSSRAWRRSATRCWSSATRRP